MRIERRPGRRLMNDINVVPYIDVMLVLLVIFMITAPLINPGQIELPQIGESLAPAPAPLEVSIHADGRMTLRDRAGNGNEAEISKSELIRAIKEKQLARPDQPVVIAADKTIRYEAVMNVLDMLQEERVKKVGLLAQPRAN